MEYIGGPRGHRELDGPMAGTASLLPLIPRGGRQAAVTALDPGGGDGGRPDPVREAGLHGVCGPDATGLRGTALDHR